MELNQGIMEKKDIRTVDVDEVLISLGGTGRYQMIQYVLVILSWFSEAYHSLSIVFLAQANEHFCSPKLTSTITKNQSFFEYNPASIDYNQTHFEYGSCTMKYMYNATFEYNTSTCIHGYQYSQPKEFSLVSDFDLVCNNAHFADLSQTLLFVGATIGAATLTMASDMFGRKTVCIFSHLFSLVFGIALSFSPDIITFLILRLLLGIFVQGTSLNEMKRVLRPTIQGTSLTSVTLAVELFPTSKRKIVGSAGVVVWGLMVSTLAPLMYVVRMYSWRVGNLVLTVVSTYSLIQYWVVDESIRWLIANNKIDQTVALIKKASKINKLDPNKTIQILYKEELKPVKSQDKDEEINGGNNGVEISQMEIERKMKYSILDVFKSRRVGCSFFIMWFAWFTNSLVYYGIFLTSSILAGNMYLNFFLNCIVEIPAALIYWFTIDRFGRKKTCIMFHLMAAIGLIVATFLRIHGTEDWTNTTATVFSLIGKLGISGSFIVIYFYTPEIFPTNIRNVSFGSCSTGARIGGMLAPFSSLLAAHIPWAPGAIFGVCCFIVTGLVVLLPESAGRELPQNMEELKSFYKADSRNNNKI